MTLPTTTTHNDCEPDDSDMFGPPRSSPPPSHQRGIDGTNGGYHHHRSRVPMISPKLRQREERKRILQLCAHKLERIKDSETNLRRSVCINNTYCRLTDELRREKQSRYLANLPKSESKPETAHDNIFNPYNSCSLDNSNHQSAAQQHNNNNSNHNNNNNNNNNKSISNTSSNTTTPSANSYYHHSHRSYHNGNIIAIVVDDDDDDEDDDVDDCDVDIDDAIINNPYNSNMNSSLCDIENQPALGHQGQLGHVNSNHNNNNNNKLHATDTYSNCIATSNALNENSNSNTITNGNTTSTSSSSSSSLLSSTTKTTTTTTSISATATGTASTTTTTNHSTHTATSSLSSSLTTTTTIATATTGIMGTTSTAAAATTTTTTSIMNTQRKRHISSSNFDTDLERLDRELNAINAPMLLIDPEITQGAEQLERAISSRKRLRSEDESDRLVREALSQFYIPPQRFISAIEDCPLDVVGVGNVGLNMGNISPKRQKLNSGDLDLDFDVNQNSKDFEVIMDALRLGTPSPTSMANDSCGQAAMMSEAASVFHNLVVTSLET